MDSNPLAARLAYNLLQLAQQHVIPHVSAVPKALEDAEA